MGQRCEFKDLDGTYVCEYLDISLAVQSVILLIFSLQWETTTSSRCQPLHRLQRRDERLRGGRHHHPRHRHGRFGLHQAQTPSEDEEDWGDQVRQAGRSGLFLTRDLSRRQTLEYSEESTTSPGVSLRLEDDRSDLRWARSEEREEREEREESVMRGTISYCLAATPTQVFRAPR